MLWEIANTPIGRLELRRPVRLRPDTRLLELVTAMKDSGRGAAIIEDAEGCIAGIITERDIIRRLDHSNHAWHDMPVSEVMVHGPQNIEQHQSLREALAIMSAGKFRHLPVVDADRRVLGILSIRDILVYVASFFPEEFLNLPPDPDSGASQQYGA